MFEDCGPNCENKFDEGGNLNDLCATCYKRATVLSEKRDVVPLICESVFSYAAC